jgi:hypothetical protein
MFPRFDYAFMKRGKVLFFAIQAANGVSRNEMKRIADIAVRHLGY